MSIVVIWKGRAFWPSMTRVASEMKLQFIVLLMKGKDREALRVERNRSDRVATRRLSPWCDIARTPSTLQQKVQVEL